MPATFTMNQAQYDAFDREVLIAPWMVAEMLRRAEAGARFAQSIAPRRSGNYARSIKPDVYIRRIPVLDGKVGRAVGRVTAHDPDAFQIEFGTKDTPAHRTIGKSLSAMRTA